MKAPRYKSRPFFSWRGFVFGAVLTGVALALGFCAAIALKGHPT